MKKIYEANDDEDKQLMADEPFAGLDLRYARCFGYSQPKENNWLFIAQQVNDVGWNHIDKIALEDSLTKDVEKSYSKIAQFKLTNVDDEMNYSLSFDNNKSLWDLSITNSPKAEIDIQERADFFKSNMFKKIAKQTYNKLLIAKQTYDEVIKYHLENGELLSVDVVKLDAIISFLKTEHFLDNVLNGKYLNY